MLSLILSFAIAFGLAIFTHGAARRFVRDRLRYVDAAHRGATPWIAGGAAFLVGAMLAPVLPFVGLGTALTVGFAVGSGVAAGSRDVKSGSAPVVWGA